MSVHTSLLELPSKLVNLGLQVWEADEWRSGQCEGNDHYVFTDPFTEVGSHDQAPSGYMVHHSGSSTATPPPHNTSKANFWVGLERDGRLYQSGGGVPTIYLASAGPARISSGYGYKPALWEHTFKDLRAPASAQGNDTGTAGNRYLVNVEVVHVGDGSLIDPGVWDHVVGLGVALHEMFGWSERSLGHRSWTKRKIDPRWSAGMPNDGNDCIIDIQDEIARLLGDEAVPPPYGEAPNIGETLPHQTASWQKAFDFNNKNINKDTHPQDTLTKGDMMVFHDRMGFFNE